MIQYLRGAYTILDVSDAERKSETPVSKIVILIQYLKTYS